MRKLLILAVVVFVGWYGWKHYPDLIAHRPSHEVVVRNHSDSGMMRVRVIVDGQTFVRDDLPNGAEAVFPFRVAHDATFQLVWQWTNREGERQWTGGTVAQGPLVQRHIMTVNGDDDVIYEREAKPQ
ncbi:MAG: hypothetical protein HY076_06750 [Candidatus Eisenbacteria bacterium]|uniref:Uncharacterized protein n=1 Tax=Eiseniibacteriota bacterium TaxID=2212470 RepID=A0A9D6L973_UNCEI|nr:hypothetical protein [Candidatus Eisenbacteria bacterium]MBI3539955.1 hypothetical protein [Candidatus Eisenbacteria bacterium]